MKDAIKILIVTHAGKDYEEGGINNAWEYYPHYFKKFGADVKVIHKKEWVSYLPTFKRFKPDIVVSIGRIAGLITAAHHMIFNSKTLFVHDLTDHPFFYKSGKRIRFIVKNHDITTTSSRYNMERFGCDFLVPNGSDFKPVKLNEKDIKWDACYLGQMHLFYKIDQLIKDCKKANIKLKIINNVPTKEVPYYIARSKICAYPISWDSSTKIVDYAAMGKPIAAIKPNLAENIDMPAHYCENLADGIKFLLANKKTADVLGRKARQWFLGFADSWENLSKRYLDYLASEYCKKNACWKNKKKVGNKKNSCNMKEHNANKKHDDRNRQIFTMDVEKDIDAGVEFAKLLHKKGLVGEFYICGYLVEKYPEKVKAIAKLGHIMGGHGYNHEDFAKLSHAKAEKIIRMTINAFRANNINIQGWRFPGLSFRNSQMKILADYELYDSSIRDIQIKRWGRLIFLRNWLRNLKKGNIFLPTLFPSKLIEKPWSFADLNETQIFLKRGRLLMHCYKYNRFRNKLTEDNCSSNQLQQ